MKSRWLVILLALAASFASAQSGLKPSEMKMKATLHTVITQQLEAFRADDYAAAYVFAHDGIKTIYSLERFERMVKTGFPALAKSASAKCGLTFDDGDDAVVNVRVVGADGEAADYQYRLHRVGDVWRIAGVVPLKIATIEV